MARYNINNSLFSSTGKRYKTISKYPEIPLSENDTYVYTTAGDRYDILANQYYGDSSLWWVIQSANPQQPADTYFPQPGTQLRIPTNVGSILSKYEKLNEE